MIARTLAMKRPVQRSSDVAAALLGSGERRLASTSGQSAGSALWTYGVRLDDANRPLPNGATIVSAGEAGLIADGRQAGAEWKLIGSIQLWEAGDQSRVTARRLRVETAEIGEVAETPREPTPARSRRRSGWRSRGSGSVRISRSR